jgi:hypothetical protein
LHPPTFLKESGEVFTDYNLHWLALLAHPLTCLLSDDGAVLKRRRRRSLFLKRFSKRFYI